MTKPIGYFTACPQGQRLIGRFGDKDLAGLPQFDQIALVLALGGFLMTDLVATNGYGKALSLDEAAGKFIPEAYLVETSDHFNAAIAILMGINSDDATNIIQFLVQ